MSNTIFFRVDASDQMGSGHVMRCLTLANGLRRTGHLCEFICRQHRGNLINKIQEEGFEVHVLTSSKEKLCASTGAVSSPYESWLGASYERDAEQSLHIIKQARSSLIVVDHYGIDQRWEALVRGASEKLLVIDDLADRPHRCDYLLDQTLGRHDQDYQSLVPESCELKLGPHYALIREEFREHRSLSLTRRNATPELKHLLVSMGGGDNMNVTSAVIGSLEKTDLPSEVKLTIVVGALSPHADTIKVLAAQSRFQVEVLFDVRNMSTLMLESDLAIGASGTTTWERCCLGLPTLLVVLAENQWPTAKAVVEEGAVLLVGEPKDIASRLPSLILQASSESTLKALCRHASGIVDGEGVFRLITEIGFDAKSS